MDKLYDIISPFVYFIIGITIDEIRRWITSRKKIDAIQRTTSVIENNNGYTKLKLYYDSIEIKVLKHTTISIKNSGNIIIENDDIVNDKKMEITVPNEATFFECYIDKISNSATNPEIQMVNRNLINISFEYLDKGDEFTVILLHNSKTEPLLAGKIKSGSVIINNDEYKNITGELKGTYTLLIFGVIFLVTACIYIPNLIKDNENWFNIFFITSFLLGIPVLSFTNIPKMIRLIKKKNKIKKGL